MDLLRRDIMIIALTLGTAAFLYVAAFRDLISTSPPW